QEPPRSARRVEGARQGLQGGQEKRESGEGRRRRVLPVLRRPEQRGDEGLAAGQDARPVRRRRERADDRQRAGLGRRRRQRRRLRGRHQDQRRAPGQPDRLLHDPPQRAERPRQDEGRGPRGGPEAPEREAEDGGKEGVVRYNGRMNKATIISELKRALTLTIPFFEAEPAFLQKSYGPGKWTARQILSHLADTEILFQYRTRIIMSQPGCDLAVMDQDKWAKTL